MRFKVISDGQFTRVVNTTTGEEVDGVTSVVWEHTTPGDLSTVRISVIDVEAEINQAIDERQSLEVTSLSDTVRRYLTRHRELLAKLFAKKQPVEIPEPTD